MILPAVCLGVYLAPVRMRLTRSEMLEVLTQDYIRTALSINPNQKMSMAYPVAPATIVKISQTEPLLTAAITPRGIATKRAIANPANESSTVAGILSKKTRNTGLF